MNIKSILFVGLAAMSLAGCQKEINNTTLPGAVAKDDVTTNSALDYYNCGDANSPIIINKKNLLNLLHSHYKSYC